MCVCVSVHTRSVRIWPLGHWGTRSPTQTLSMTWHRRVSRMISCSESWTRYGLDSAIFTVICNTVHSLSAVGTVWGPHRQHICTVAYVRIYVCTRMHTYHTAQACGCIQTTLVIWLIHMHVCDMKLPRCTCAACSGSAFLPSWEGGFLGHSTGEYSNVVVLWRGITLNAGLCLTPFSLAGLDGCTEWWGEAEDCCEWTPL